MKISACSTQLGEASYFDIAALPENIWMLDAEAQWVHPEYSYSFEKGKDPETRIYLSILHALVNRIEPPQGTTDIIVCTCPTKFIGVLAYRRSKLT